VSEVALVEDSPEEIDGTQEQEIMSLGSRLSDVFTEYKDSRKETENEWLSDLRQFQGLYEPDVLARLNESGARSKVFVGLTRTKVMAAYSRIVDLLFQHGDSFFGIEPTPIPQLDPLKMMQMREMAVSQVIAASGMSPEQNEDLIVARLQELEEEFLEAEKEIARKAADQMKVEIHDQLIEANAEQKLKEAILESCIFGSGAIKAGTVRIDRVQSYSRVADPMTGAMGFALSQIEKAMPEVESVSIFDLYPDPYCTNLDDCEGLFRRHVLTRSQLRDLADRPGFDADMIRYLIKNNRQGNHTEEEHERTRRRIAGINEHAESSNRFEVIEYWGEIDGHELEEHGVEMPEDADLSEYFSACVWFSGGKVIKVMLNPIMGYKIPYHIFPYEKSPHQFWGTGVPRMMRDSQVTMNAATRIWIDNLALSSGPMMEVNTDLLAAGEDPTDIHPWRVFLREGGDGSMPAVRFYQPIANANGLNQIVELFRRFADETTSLPSYTHGEQTRSLNKTATGISMLMGAANVALKSTIKNIDDFLLEPMIEALFHFNMEFGTNEKAKGDLKVIPRGSTALVQKEVQSQRLLQFLSLVSNPMDAAMIDRTQLLRDIAQSLDIDPDEVIKSEERLQAEQALQAQALAGASQGGVMAQEPGPMEIGLGPVA
tara:strand:- start:1479 stop:3449 length:1971 start_codon:yes stop_codon:yes gene_type:complete